MEISKSQSVVLLVAGLALQPLFALLVQFVESELDDAVLLGELERHSSFVGPDHGPTIDLLPLPDNRHRGQLLAQGVRVDTEPLALLGVAAHVQFGEAQVWEGVTEEQT